MHPLVVSPNSTRKQRRDFEATPALYTYGKQIATSLASLNPPPLITREGCGRVRSTIESTTLLQE
jgi:hypothetical protein